MTTQGHNSCTIASLCTNNIVYFFSCFSLFPLNCLLQYSALSHHGTINWCSVFRVWIFLMPVMNIYVFLSKTAPKTKGTGRVIHLVMWPQLAQMDSCTGASVALQWGMYMSTPKLKTAADIGNLRILKRKIPFPHLTSSTWSLCFPFSRFWTRVL